MRWVAAIVLSLALVGCPTVPDAPALPPEPSKGNPVDAYADGADRVMDIAAAAVAVAKDANQAGKPSVVDAELGVASNALPRPSAGELGKAKARAAKADPKDYTAAQAKADTLQRELDTLWGKVEAEKEKARAALQAKEAELAAERAKVRDLLWTGAGLLLVLAGGLGLVWGSGFGVTKAEAVTLALLGFAVGSLPWLLESDLSAWVLVPAGGLVALRGVLWVWSRGWKKSDPLCNAKSNTPPDGSP